MIENSGLRHFIAYRSAVIEMWTPQYYGQGDAHGYDNLTVLNVTVNIVFKTVFLLFSYLKVYL